MKRNGRFHVRFLLCFDGFCLNDLLWQDFFKWRQSNRRLITICHIVTHKRVITLPCDKREPCCELHSTSSSLTTIVSLTTEHDSHFGLLYTSFNYTFMDSHTHTSSALSFAPSRVPKHSRPPSQHSGSSSKHASTSKGTTTTHTSPTPTHIVSSPKPIAGLTTNDAASTESKFCNLCRCPVPNTYKYLRCDTCREKNRTSHQEYRKRVREKKQAMKTLVADPSVSNFLSNGHSLGELRLHAPVLKKHHSIETPIQKALQSSQVSALTPTQQRGAPHPSSRSRPKPTPSNVEMGGDETRPSEKVLGKRKAIVEVDFKQASKRNKPSKTTSFKPTREEVYQTASQLFSEMCSRLKVASTRSRDHFFEGCYSIVADPSISLQGRTERVHWTLYEKFRFPVA